MATATVLIGLGSLGLPIGGLAQTKMVGSQPAPSPTMVGGPTGLFTIYDGNVLATGESFGRDPGTIHTTRLRVASRSNDQGIKVPSGANTYALLLEKPYLQLALWSVGKFDLNCSTNLSGLLFPLFDFYHQYDKSQLDGSVTSSRMYRLPLKFTFGATDPEPAEESHKFFGSFRFGATYRFGETSLSTDVPTPQLNSGLRSIGGVGIFYNIDPKQVSLSSDPHNGLVGFIFNSAPKLFDSQSSASPFSERADEHIYLGNDSTIRGYNVRSIGSFTSLGSYSPNSLDSSKTFLADDVYVEDRVMVKPNATSFCRPAITPEHSGVTLDLGSKPINTLDDYTKAGDQSYLSGEYRQALGSYLKALSYLDMTGDQTDKAQILMNVGVVYRALGESAKALAYFKEALSIKGGTPENNRDPLLLYNIGLAHLDIGERSEALSCFDEALSLNTLDTSVTARRMARRGLILNGIGSVHASLGELAEALNSYNQALVLLKNSEDSVGEAIVLNNLGKLHNSLGGYVQALNYLNEALVIRERLSDRRGQGDTLYEIGNVYFNLNKMKEADNQYGYSLSLFTSIDDRLGESLSLRGLGRVRAPSNQGEAAGYYKRAMAIAEVLGDQEIIALTLTDLGRLYKDNSDTKNALASYQRALELSRRLNDPTNEAVNLYEISLVNRNLGHFDQSRISLEEAISIVESRREQVSGFELRSTYSASIQKYYGLYIDVLVSLNEQRPLGGFDAKAFEASERARARTLLDSLGEARTEIRSGINPLLLERERLAQQALNNTAAKQTQLLSRPHTEQEAAAIANEVETSLNEYQEIETNIKSQTPANNRLSQTQPRSLREIREQVLDSDSLMLSYVLGSERSFLFAITLDSLAVYVLPKRSVIEPEVFKTYQLLASRAQTLDNQTRGSEELELIDREAAFEGENQRLSEMLLGPLTKELSKKRFLIITDGALQIVSFAALQAPDNGVSHTTTPLVVDHEIVNLPSASTLAMLRKQSASRKRPPKTVAVFADPIFSDTDPRLPRVEQGTAGGSDTKYNFPRLPFSTWEAEQITSLVPKSDALLATGFSASLKTATSEELKQYRIVHFATHGTINEEHPELSSIVLSLFDKDGHPENGFLRLSEIYKMNLPVELVVLSGCRTGLGKEIPGEGLRSVTQGFMFAGASRVIFSLWAVDDRVTAELMVRFYRKMLSNGLPAAEALREAQIEMWKDSRWNSAYFWAPFVLQGEAN